MQAAASTKMTPVSSRVLRSMPTGIFLLFFWRTVGMDCLDTTQADVSAPMLRNHHYKWCAVRFAVPRRMCIQRRERRGRELREGHWRLPFQHNAERAVESIKLDWYNVQNDFHIQPKKR